MLELNTQNFEAEIIKGKIPAIVDFWAEWCPPCRLIAPIFEKISAEYKGRLKFAKVNVDENRNLAEKYEIKAIPSLVVFDNGKEIERIMGALKEEHLKAKINDILVGI